MKDSEKNQLFTYISLRQYAVQATVNADNKPQAAVIGVAVTPALELIFDTEKTSRKYKNFLHHPYMALVIGWDDETTIQYEGTASEPAGDNLAEYKRIYFQKFPDGREREKWPEIAYIMVKPKWIRFSDFSKSPPEIREWNL